jgi:hypothetical protein
MTDKVKPITLAETGINQFEGIAIVPNQTLCITKIEFKNNSRFETTMITSLDADGEEREYYTTSKVIKQIAEEILNKHGDIRGFVNPPITCTVVEKRSANKQFYLTLA